MAVEIFIVWETEDSGPGREMTAKVQWQQTDGATAMRRSGKLMLPDDGNDYDNDIDIITICLFCVQHTLQSA